MCSANAGRICQAGAQAFPSHRGTEATGACASLQIRGVKPGNCRTTADTGTAPATSWGGIWAGKAESLRLLSYTHWPQRSASYGRGDTLKVPTTPHLPDTENTNCSASTPLVFPVTRLRDVHICLVNYHLLSFTFSCSAVNKQAGRTDD